MWILEPLPSESPERRGMVRRLRAMHVILRLQNVYSSEEQHCQNSPRFTVSFKSYSKINKGLQLEHGAMWQVAAAYREVEEGRCKMNYGEDIAGSPWCR